MMNLAVNCKLKILFLGACLLTGAWLFVVLAGPISPTALGRPLAVCTVTPAYGQQPFPATMVPRFTQAARDTLPTPRPAYTPIARGLPTQYPGGAGVTTRQVSTAEPIPDAILKAMAWVEGDQEAWYQFDAWYGQYGYTKVSDACDYGVMQVNQDSMGGMNPDLIASSTSYNIGAGTRWLIGKWNWMSTPTCRLISPNDHQLAENWYYAVTAYQSWNSENDPLNMSNFRNRRPQRPPYLEASQPGNEYWRYSYTYQEKVWGWMAHPGTYNGQPLWSAARVPWVPRGIWGLGRPTDWHRPAEWTSRPTFYYLPDVKANSGGWDSYLLLQNAIAPSYNYTLAADVAFYDVAGSFNRWWLDPPWEATAPPVQIAPQSVRVLAAKDAFRRQSGGQDSFSGPSLLCAGQDVGVVVQNATANQVYAYVGTAWPGTVPDVGYSVAGPTAYLPRLCNNYQGWSTAFTVQNVGAEATDVNITYYDANTGQAQGCASAHLEPNAAATVAQYTGGRVMNWSLGSGIVASNNGQPLAVTVKEQHGSGTTTAYNALTQGAARVHAPLLLADSGGWPVPSLPPVGNYRVYLPLVLGGGNPWYTDLVVQNVGTATTNITVQYYPAPGSAAKSSETHWNVSPGQGTIFRTTGGPWVGAAEVTSNNEMPLAVVVHQETAYQDQAGSYSGATGGATRVLLPLAAKAYANWRSVMAVQNLGNSPTAVTLDCWNMDGSFAGSQTITISQQWGPYVFYPLPVADGFRGSIVVTSGDPIAVMTNMLEGDARMMTYNGLPR